MDINRNNYEAFLLDLAEGRLNAEESQQVRDFLMLNPDCATGLEPEHTWFLEPGSISFPQNEQDLLSTINPNLYRGPPSLFASLWVSLSISISPS